VLKRATFQGPQSRAKTAKGARSATKKPVRIGAGHSNQMMSQHDQLTQNFGHDASLFSQNPLTQGADATGFTQPQADTSQIGDTGRNQFSVGDNLMLSQDPYGTSGLDFKSQADCGLLSQDAWPCSSNEAATQSQFSQPY
jgi:hypothetical protein